MQLTDILICDNIAINMKSVDKVDAFRKLLNLIAKSGCFTDTAGVLNEVIKRERILSTGIGSGIAIPHCKTPLVKSMGCALATLEKPINYNAVDGQPVSIVCMFVCNPDNVTLQLKMLENISYVLTNNDLKNEIRHAVTAMEVLSVFKKVLNQS